MRKPGLFLISILAACGTKTSPKPDPSAAPVAANPAPPKPACVIAGTYELEITNAAWTNANGGDDDRVCEVDTLSGTKVYVEAAGAIPKIRLEDGLDGKVTRVDDCTFDVEVDGFESTGLTGRLTFGGAAPSGKITAVQFLHHGEKGQGAWVCASRTGTMRLVATSPSAAPPAPTAAACLAPGRYAIAIEGARWKNARRGDRRPCSEEVVELQLGFNDVHVVNEPEVLRMDDHTRHLVTRNAGCSYAIDIANESVALRGDLVFDGPKIGGRLAKATVQIVDDGDGGAGHWECTTDRGVVSLVKSS